MGVLLPSFGAFMACDVSDAGLWVLAESAEALRPSSLQQSRKDGERKQRSFHPRHDQSFRIETNKIRRMQVRWTRTVLLCPDGDLASSERRSSNRIRCPACLVDFSRDHWMLSPEVEASLVRPGAAQRVGKHWTR